LAHSSHPQLAAALPFFAGWAVAGTSWSLPSMETPTCLSSGSRSWFIFILQTPCYAWIAMYSVFVGKAWQQEHPLKAMVKDYHCLAATEDALCRRGQLLFLPDSDSLKSHGLCQGEIQSLPRSRFGAVIGTDKCHLRRECAICLMEFQSRDACRELPGCGHVFHESCIDLWLLRQGACPLCKHRIQACDALS